MNKKQRKKRLKKLNWIRKHRRSPSTWNAKEVLKNLRKMGSIVD